MWKERCNSEGGRVRMLKLRGVSESVGGHACEYVKCISASSTCWSRCEVLKDALFTDCCSRQFLGRRLQELDHIVSKNTDKDLQEQ